MHLGGSSLSSRSLCQSVSPKQVHGPCRGDLWLVPHGIAACQHWLARSIHGRLHHTQHQVKRRLICIKNFGPILNFFASSSSPVCLLINMHKKLFLVFMQWVAMMYFYDNCFSMMFLSDFWLQSWMNRWFAGNEELPTQASRISMRLILIFYASPWYYV